MRPAGSKKTYHILHTKGGTILLTVPEFYKAKERADKYGYNKQNVIKWIYIIGKILNG